jgi:hypothetical protein
MEEIAMKLRKLLAAAGAVTIATLAGCATYPYDDYAYPDGPRYSEYGPDYYRPGYYAGPSVGLGITYSNRDYDGWRHRHAYRYP